MSRYHILETFPKTLTINSAVNNYEQLPTINNDVGLITVHGPGAPGAPGAPRAPKTLTLRVLGAPGAPGARGSHGSPYLLHDLQTHVDRSKVKEQLTKFGKVNLANNMLLLMNFQLSLSLIKSSLNLFPNAHADTGYEFRDI